MIQRIQTVYFVLAFIVLSLSFVFPFSSFDLNPDSTLILTKNGLFLNEVIVEGYMWSFPVSVFLSFILLSLLVVIFMFKKLNIQALIGKLLYVVLLGYILFLYVNSNELMFFIQNTYQIENVKLLYLYSFYAPIVAVTFLFLANRGIKKDMDLLKSLDRLR